MTTEGLRRIGVRGAWPNRRHSALSGGAVDRSEIIDAIKRIAAANEGKAPGRERFEGHTGLTRESWQGRYWRSWSEALTEAGFEPNSLAKAIEDTVLLAALASLTAERGQFPTEVDLRMKRRVDLSFPAHSVFKRLGGKNERIRKLLEYCEAQGGLEHVVEILKQVEVPSKPNDLESNEAKDVPKLGYVYLVKHGNRSEYKIGKTYNALRREGEIRLELPGSLTPVHTIKTDDPSGVERYWHHRFKEKNLNGEWFDLTKADVQAFKRWRRIA
jgi:hypothetical protein